MTERPAWFDVTFTGYEHPEDIPCSRRLPEESIPLGQFYWGNAPGMDCVEQYCVSGNRGRQHYILWAAYFNEEAGRWLYVPAAYAPQKSASGERLGKRQSGLWLLEELWRKDHSHDGAPMQEGFAHIEPDVFDEMCGRVWAR